MTSGFKSVILLTLTALIFLLNPFFSKNVSATTINFEDLAAGEALYDQYSSQGIYFRDQLDLSGNSPGVIAASGYASSRSFAPNQYASPIFILLTDPVASFNFYKFENYPPEEQPPQEQPPVEEQPPQEAPQDAPSEDYTVHLEFYKFDGINYVSLGTIQNSDKDAWVPVYYTSIEPISAIKMYGTYTYYADNLQFERPQGPAVPEPSTMLFLSSFIFGIFGLRLNRKA